MTNELKDKKALTKLKEQYPDKFVSVNQAIKSIHRGDRIFVHTACGEPQYLLKSLAEYIESDPKAVFDAEVLQVWSLGLAPYAQEKFKHNFRHNSFKSIFYNRFCTCIYISFIILCYKCCYFKRVTI